MAKPDIHLNTIQDGAIQRHLFSGSDKTLAGALSQARTLSRILEFKGNVFVERASEPATREDFLCDDCNKRAHVDENAFKIPLAVKN